MSQNLMAMRMPARQSPNTIDLSDDDCNENKTSFLSNESMPSREDEVDSLTSNDSNNKSEGKELLWVIPNEEMKYCQTSSKLESGLNSSNVSLNTSTPGSAYLMKSQEAKRIYELSQRLNSPTLTTYDRGQGNKNVNFGNRNEVKHESEVYFRYNDKLMKKIYDFNSRPDLVVGLQTYARRYLAKQRFNRKRFEDENVMIIQSNADLYIDPWINLFKQIRPLLVHHKSDRYLSKLKGKIVILKSTIKSLKTENTDFSDRLNQLTQKLMRAHGSANKAQFVQQNLNELNQEIMSHSNNFSKILERNNRRIEDCGANEFPSLGINDDSENELVLEETTFASGSDTYSVSNEINADSGIMLRKKKYNSTIINPVESLARENRAASLVDKARDDADFYRMQVELLREEAECQHQSANNHYEEKIIVLSSRIEQLQNQLNEEMNRGDKLKKELDEALHVAAESKICEKSLQSIVEKLCKQLEDYRDIPRDNTDDSNAKESIDKDTFQKLKFCRDYVEGLRNHFTANPRELHNTIFEPGAEFDIFEDRFLANMSSYSTPFNDCNHNLASMKGGRPKNLPDSILQSGQVSAVLSPMIINDSSAQKKLEEKLINLTKRLDFEIEEKEGLEFELNELRNKLTSIKRDNNRLREDHQEELDEFRNKYQRKINELEEQLEEEMRLKKNTESMVKNLERQLISMRRASEYSELEHVNDERQEIERRLKEDVIYYKSSLDRIQEEFDEFKTRNDPQRFREEIEEKDQRIILLTHEKSKLLKDSEITAIKLQTNNTILEENENRLRQMTKERNNLLTRMAQLESERDHAIKESALLAGKHGADKETVAARAKEVDELRGEKEILRRELTEVRNELTEIKFNSSSETQNLLNKIKETEKNMSRMKEYFDSTLSSKEFVIRALQADNEIIFANDKHLKNNNRVLKRQLDELEEQKSKNLKKISELERNYKDIVEERDRAKSDFTAARETADYLRASRTRLDEEVSSSIGDTEGIQYRRLFSRTPTVTSPEGYDSILKRKSMSILTTNDSDLPTPEPQG